MDKQPIRPGELLEYLEGGHLPHVEQALSGSPEMRQEMKTLLEVTNLFRNLFSRESPVDSQDLVDVVSGQATPQQQQRVDAYLQRDARGRAHMRALEEELQAVVPKMRSKPLNTKGSAPLKGKPRLRLPHFQAWPVALGGVRGATFSIQAEQREQSFHAAELNGKATLRVEPLQGERWQVVGQILHAGIPVVGARVTLRSATYRPRVRTTDIHGLFSFAKVPEGNYRFEAKLDAGVLFIPEIVLRYE
jgi:hypothetical protein